MDALLRELAEPPVDRRPCEVRLVLQCLHAKLEGALALLSVRRIVEVDAMLEPCRFCCTGARGSASLDSLGLIWLQPATVMSPTTRSDTDSTARTDALAAQTQVCTHGAAIASLMEGAPFRGRLPVCIGDEMTDQGAFAVATDRGGFAVNVSADSSGDARHAIAALLDAIRWLDITAPTLRPPTQSCRVGLVAAWV
jgi:trehalose-6-phosphatase